MQHRESRRLPTRARRTETMVAPWISERALATHPEVFSLSEIILEAHRSLAQKLRGSGEVERMKTSRLLRSFVPKLVRQDVAAHDANLRQRDARGAVLFADASGFTVREPSRSNRLTHLP